jgi:arylsulfatase A-like enzyme
MMARWIRLFPVFFLFTLTVAAAFAAGEDHDASPAAPWSAGQNVILISIDTLRRDHLPIYGYERDTSPNLAALADEGVVFDSAIAVHTNTTPSHASMLTGRYPARHGIVQNGMPLRPRIPTLPGLLRDEGLVTGAFVSSWTLTDRVGLDAGFDVYDCELSEDRERIAQDTVDRALPWLRARASAGERFFLFLHLFDPHFPYAAPADCTDRFAPEGQSALSTELKRQLPRKKSDSGLNDQTAREYVSRYDGEIFYADRHVGRFLDELERLGLAEHTLIVFTSDHGESLWERDWVFDHGARAYDEQIRVPFVVRFPDGRESGERRAAQVSHVDIMPTVLDYLEIDGPDDLDGRSLLRLVERETEADRRRPAFAHARVAPDRVPEIGAELRQIGLISVVRYPDLKLIEYPAAQEDFYKQLFALDADPGERNNLAHDDPRRAKTLHDQLEHFRRETRADRVGAPPELPPEIEEGLRALGYID